MKTSTPNAMVYGETGSPPLVLTIKLKMINFWMRMVIGKQEKLMSKMYRVLLNLFNNNVYKSPWLNFIKNILDNCGLTYVWDNQDKITHFTNDMTVLEKNNMINVQFVKTAVKNIIHDQYIQKWRADINASEKCCLYKHFKLDFKCEKYLTVLPSKLRIALCKFRIANTKLPIEEGRYSNVPRHLRYCKLCNSNVIGDEFHLLLQCPATSYIRKMYLPKYYSKHINMVKFVHIMSTKSRKLLVKIARFLVSAFEMLK